MAHIEHTHENFDNSNATKLVIACMIPIASKKTTVRMKSIINSWASRLVRYIKLKILPTFHCRTTSSIPLPYVLN